MPDLRTEALPVVEAGVITQQLQAMWAGDARAHDALFALAYGELRKLAHARLERGRGSDTLDTTALVHEAYIRFMQSSESRPEDRRSISGAIDWSSDSISRSSALASIRRGFQSAAKRPPGRRMR